VDHVQDELGRGQAQRGGVVGKAPNQAAGRVGEEALHRQGGRANPRVGTLGEGSEHFFAVGIAEADEIDGGVEAGLRRWIRQGSGELLAGQALGAHRQKRARCGEPNVDAGIGEGRAGQTQCERPGHRAGERIDRRGARRPGFGGEGSTQHGLAVPATERKQRHRRANGNQQVVALGGLDQIAGAEVTAVLLEILDGGELHAHVVVVHGVRRHLDDTATLAAGERTERARTNLPIGIGAHHGDQGIGVLVRFEAIEGAHGSPPNPRVLVAEGAGDVVASEALDLATEAFDDDGASPRIGAGEEIAGDFRGGDVRPQDRDRSGGSDDVVVTPHQLDDVRGQCLDLEALDGLDGSHSNFRRRHLEALPEGGSRHGAQCSLVGHAIAKGEPALVVRDRGPVVSATEAGADLHVPERGVLGELPEVGVGSSVGAVEVSLIEQGLGPLDARRRGAAGEQQGDDEGGDGFHGDSGKIAQRGRGPTLRGPIAPWWQACPPWLHRCAKQRLGSDAALWLSYAKRMAIRAILFDLDGTLVDSERESAEAMARALEAGQGITIGQDDRDHVIGRSWVDIHRSLQSRYPSLAWTLSELIAETSVIREKMFEESGIEPLPGALGALERFAHLPKAIVTGSSRAEAEHALRSLAIRHHFDALFAAEDVPTSKPHPAGYLSAAQALQVDPAHCVVLEDSTAGIAAGRAAGAWVVAIRQGNFANQDQSQAHRIIDSLDEVTADLLEELLRGI